MDIRYYKTKQNKIRVAHPDKGMGNGDVGADGKSTSLSLRSPPPPHHFTPYMGLETSSILLNDRNNNE